jgi:hypothetical protein
MKLLVHGFRDQPMYSLFNRLASCLETNGQHQVLFSNQESSSDTQATQDVIKRIKPDVVIFNKKTQLPKKSNVRYLYLDLAKIEPFAYLPQSKRQESSPIYACDVVYIGNPMVFEEGLKILTESEFVFKFFEKRPAFVSGYCGSLDGSMGQDVIIRSAKAAVTMPADKYRLLNIIASGGNPVVFQNPEQFYQDIEKATKGVKFFGGISRNDIKEAHTSHDRMIEFLKRVGLSSMLSTVIENKETAWGTE